MRNFLERLTAVAVVVEPCSKTVTRGQYQSKQYFSYNHFRMSVAFRASKQAKFASCKTAAVSVRPRETSSIWGSTSTWGGWSSLCSSNSMELDASDAAVKHHMQPGTSLPAPATPACYTAPFGQQLHCTAWTVTTGMPAAQALEGTTSTSRTCTSTASRQGATRCGTPVVPALQQCRTVTTGLQAAQVPAYSTVQPRQPTSSLFVQTSVQSLSPTSAGSQGQATAGSQAQATAGSRRKRACNSADSSAYGCPDHERGHVDTWCGEGQPDKPTTGGAPLHSGNISRNFKQTACLCLLKHLGQQAVELCSAAAIHACAVATRLFAAHRQVSSTLAGPLPAGSAWQPPTSPSWTFTRQQPTI